MIFEVFFWLNRISDNLIVLIFRKLFTYRKTVCITLFRSCQSDKVDTKKKERKTKHAKVWTYLLFANTINANIKILHGERRKKTNIEKFMFFYRFLIQINDHWFCHVNTDSKPKHITRLLCLFDLHLVYDFCKDFMPLETNRMGTARTSAIWNVFNWCKKNMAQSVTIDTKGIPKLKWYAWQHDTA